MSEFDLFAQELLEKAEAEEKQQQERDRKLIDRAVTENAAGATRSSS